MAEIKGGGGEMRGGTSYSSSPRCPFENICKRQISQNGYLQTI